MSTHLSTRLSLLHPDRTPSPELCQLLEHFGILPEQRDLASVNAAMQTAGWPKALGWPPLERDKYQVQWDIVRPLVQALGFALPDKPYPEETLRYALLPAAQAQLTALVMDHAIRILGAKAHAHQLIGLASAVRTLNAKEVEALNVRKVPASYHVSEEAMLRGLWETRNEECIHTPMKGNCPHGCFRVVSAASNWDPRTGKQIPHEGVPQRPISTADTYYEWLAFSPAPGPLYLFSAQPYGPRMQQEFERVAGPAFPVHLVEMPREELLVVAVLSEVAKVVYNEVTWSA